MFVQNDNGVAIRLFLQPRASRTEFCGLQGGEVKLRVTSPPVDDAANQLCIEFLAKALKRPKSALAITAGRRSRHKTVQVNGISLAEVEAILEDKINNP
jgi:uncharacterized protein (TIGR00251 family)